MTTEQVATLWAMTNYVMRVAEDASEMEFDANSQDLEDLRKIQEQANKLCDAISRLAARHGKPACC